MDVQFSKSVVYILNHEKPQHIWALPYPNFPKFGPHLHRYNRVRVHPYAHPQHMQWLNHFLYIEYGFGMQSGMVYSLNHETILSAVSHSSGGILIPAKMA